MPNSKTARLSRADRRGQRVGRPGVVKELLEDVAKYGTATVKRA